MPIRCALAALALLAVPATAAMAEPGPHQAWDTLLERYVEPGADGVNRVDYGALEENEDDRAALDAYIEGFATLDFDSLSRDEAFAAWVNLYNAMTVRYIVERYPVDTIRPWYSPGPWKRIKTMVNGRRVSLHRIEHDILREQWSDDPRLHYALNCASIGCPNLRTDAWTADGLDATLEDAARAYVNHPRGVEVEDYGLSVSSIYDWYKDDFGGSSEAVIDHLLVYAEPELAEAIRANPDIRDHDYDWSLNDTAQDQ